jgi:acetyl esterase/lipase
MKRALLALAVLLFAAAALVHSVRAERRVVSNIVYLPGHADLDRLDLYLQSGTRVRPTVVYFHGGGWGPGTRKEDIKVRHLPFLYLGWNVVNVEYRRSDTAPAPAAVQDSICAVRWVAANAAQYHFDLDRLVLMGDSAGGHLALITAMLPLSAGLDSECPGQPPPKVAAIIDWTGTTDVNKLLQGPDERTFATAWIGGQPDLAHTLSPINQVRPGTPPVFMVHADRDPVLPYSQSADFRDALDKAGVARALVTLHDDRHLKAGRRMTAWIYLRMVIFLLLNGVFPVG